MNANPGYWKKHFTVVFVPLSLFLSLSLSLSLHHSFTHFFDFALKDFAFEYICHSMCSMHSYGKCITSPYESNYWNGPCSRYLPPHAVHFRETTNQAKIHKSQNTCSTKTHNNLI